VYVDTNLLSTKVSQQLIENNVEERCFNTFQSIVAAFACSE
jgi:hypothetical protein